MFLINIILRKEFTYFSCNFTAAKKGAFFEFSSTSARRKTQKPMNTTGSSKIKRTAAKQKMKEKGFARYPLTNYC